MLKKVLIVYRKKQKQFNSIENVFDSLILFLNGIKFEMPWASEGLVGRLKNIIELYRYAQELIHITGHDHYLLLFPFKRSILTIHDIEALKRKKGIMYWVFKKLWFDIPISNASEVTTISEFTKEELLSLKAYSTPITVIPNPLTFPLIGAPSVFNSACPRILHLGTKVNKNLSALLNALKGINCELIIIGQPDSELENEICNVNFKYQFLTGLSNRQVIQEYVKCDFVSFVSCYEGFGLPIIEAQAVGRPVITSNVTSMPEVAGAGALLVNPYSVEEIRLGIIALIRDSELRNSLLAKGTENVSRFEPKVIAAQYNKLYKKVSRY